jgi:serine/threonine protein phosphatase PrpC
MANYQGVFAYKSDQGLVRKDNEDQALALSSSQGEVFLIVCDGMGGANKGGVASKMAIDSLSASFQEKKKMAFANLERLWLAKACRKANKLIYDKADQEEAFHGMGTTLVCALLNGNRLSVANIGDSRAYLVDEGAIRQLTEDQTYVDYLVKTGKITPEEALTNPDRHALLNALGIYPSVSVTIDTFDYKGENILLCSDGIYNRLDSPTLLKILSTDERPDQKVVNLILEANALGGDDNESVSYWECTAHD